MEQKIRQLYKRLAKYRRKRDHAIHMIDSIDTEINDLYSLARRQYVPPPPATRTHNICAGVRCLTCGAMFRMCSVGTARALGAVTAARHRVSA